MPQVFVDTGAWYALLDKTDSCHARSVEFFQSLAHPLVTTNYIADETITLAKNRLGYEVAVKIGQMLWDEDVATLIHISSFDEKNAWKIFTKYQDKGFNFTDCTSFAVMERLGIIEAMAFDEHFNQYSDFIVLG